MIVAVGIVSVLYGALVALAQTDLKRMIAYTSVNHMGYIVLALGAVGLLAEDAAVPKDYFVKTKYTKLSPRTSVAAELAADVGRSVDPFYDVLVDSTANAVLEPTYDWQVSLAFGTALEKAMRGEDIDAAMQEADATITRVISDLDLAGQNE